jgi:hypothetical protein
MHSSAYIYRKYTKANRLDEQRGFKKLKTIGKNNSKIGYLDGEPPDCARLSV